jgi:hypothetical protein
MAKIADLGDVMSVNLPASAAAVKVPNLAFFETIQDLWLSAETCSG